MGIAFEESTGGNGKDSRECHTYKTRRFDRIRNSVYGGDEFLEVKVVENPEGIIDDLITLYQKAYKGLETYAYKTKEEIKEYIRWIHKRDTSGLMIVKDRERENIVAFIATDKNWIWNGENFGEIHELVVDPEYQGKGIGKLLMTKAIERFKKEGLKKVGLWVGKGNTKAKKIYEKLGFVEKETRGRWIRMEMEL